MGRLLVVLVLLGLLVLVLAGVLYVTHDNNKINLTIDKSRLDATASEAVEAGRKGLHRAGEALEKTGDKLHRENPRPDKPAPEGTAPAETQRVY
jgi:hypothetical protein